MRSNDFLEELIAEAEKSNPDVREQIDREVERRRLLRSLAEQRQARGITQSKLAQRIGVSQPAIQRLENRGDARLSTIQSYAAALGMDLNIELR